MHSSKKKMSLFILSHTHCQKRGYRKKRTLHRLTKNEKELVEEIFHKFHPPECYKIMQEKLNLPSIRTAREHCIKYLKTNSSRPFTDEEDHLILQKVNEIGRKWTTIATFFEDKSDINIRNRWRQLIKQPEKRNQNLERKVPLVQIQTFGENAKLESEDLETFELSELNDVLENIKEFDNFDPESLWC